jgi:hypothetical protein
LIAQVKIFTVFATQKIQSRTTLAQVLDKDIEKFDLACTYLKNNQSISAHNLFMSLAQDAMKKDDFKAGIYLILASECKTRQRQQRRIWHKL